MQTRVRSFRTVASEAAVAAVVLSAVGILFNLLRAGGIPLVADEAYELFVPCPEPLGEVEGLAADDPRIRESRGILIDARSPGEFAAWHPPAAENIPFDYLEGVPDTTVRRIAGSGAIRVVVYGDGQDPDSGRELARELAGRGVRNVFFVLGGAPALRSASGQNPEGAR